MGYYKKFHFFLKTTNDAGGPSLTGKTGCFSTGKANFEDMKVRPAGCNLSLASNWKMSYNLELKV
jgi:hypothetical protein